ncbi:MAG: CoA transferase [Gammaproteobacteria bacterium]|nr:CoA transferase [Gammaproteobacteria bacterium]
MPSSESTGASRATGPLSGKRIIDLTTVLAGPYATQIAADYGADVIKVEPMEGDVMRLAGAKRHGQMGPIFLHANRNKRSATLNLKDGVARDAVLALCEGADALVHNVRPQAMARLGLGYEDVKKVNPRLVYVNLVGYSKRGPYAGRPAYDDLIQGISGMASMFSLCGAAEPRYVPAVIADRISGLNAANALLAALLHSERTGEGQFVEVPMFESLVQIVLGDHMGGLSFEPPAGPPGYNRLTTPNRRPYRTLDGFLGVLIYTDRHWRDFLHAIGRQDLWESDERFRTQVARSQHYDHAYGFVSDVIRERTTAEWLELFGHHDLPAVPVHRIEDLADDPHIKATGFVETVDHPTEGLIKQVRPAHDFSATPANIFRHAPNPGEQTREVLLEAGMTGEDIDALIERGNARQF